MSKFLNKPISILAIGLITLTTLVGCNSINSTNPINSTNHSNKISISPSLVKVYDKTKDLVKDANAIVEVKILESNPTEYGRVEFTVSKAEIISVVKGELKEGDEIKLLETGGISNNGQEITFYGISTSKANDHLFLFLDKYEGPVVENAYIPLGAYQGKFKEENGKLEQQVSKEHKLTDYKPLDKNEFEQKIKSLVDYDFFTKVPQNTKQPVPNTDENRYEPSYKDINLKTDVSDLKEISKEIFDMYLKSFMEIKVTDYARISDYKIEDIKIENGNINEFQFYVEYSIKPASGKYVIAGNGIQLSDGWIMHRVYFINVNKEQEGFKISRIGTGR